MPPALNDRKDKMSKITTLRGRVVMEFDWPGAQKRFPDPLWNVLAEGYRGLRGVAEGSQVRVEELAADDRYTAKGRQALLRDWVAAEAAPSLRGGQEALAAAEAAIEALRAGMVAGQIDKADAAGAMRRREWRDRFAGMEPAARNARLRAGDLPDEAIAAVLEMPAEFSGLTAQQRDRLEEQAALSRYPEQAAKVATIAECMEAMSSAARAASLAVQADAGYARHEVEEMMGASTRSERIRKLIEGDGSPEAA